MIDLEQPHRTVIRLHGHAGSITIVRLEMWHSWSRCEVVLAGVEKVEPADAVHKVGCLTVPHLPCVFIAASLHMRFTLLVQDPDNSNDAPGKSAASATSGSVSSSSVLRQPVVLIVWSEDGVPADRPIAQHPAIQAVAKSDGANAIRLVIILQPVATSVSIAAAAASAAAATAAAGKNVKKASATTAGKNGRSGAYRVERPIVAVRVITVPGGLGAAGRGAAELRTASAMATMPMLGPLSDRMVVSLSIAPALARQTAVNATRVFDAPYYEVPPFVRRRIAIDKVMRKYQADEQGDAFVQDLFPLSNSVAERRDEDIVAAR